MAIEDLGQMPPPTMADKLAMWAAALVNPLPALGRPGPEVTSCNRLKSSVKIPLDGFFKVATF